MNFEVRKVFRARAALSWVLILGLLLAAVPFWAGACSATARENDGGSAAAADATQAREQLGERAAAAGAAQAQEQLGGSATAAAIGRGTASVSALTAAGAPVPTDSVSGSAAASASEVATAAAYEVIVIDAGHQARANSSTEPIGPGAQTRKAKVAGGTRGVATGNPEYIITLQVAKKLRYALKKRGYTVYMVRTKNDVDIPNSKRAKFANKKKADLFIRLHCDAAGQERGFLTLAPAKNKWTKKFYKKSLRAAKIIHKAVLKKTKAKDRGIGKRGDLSGFNYAKVPCVLFEMGVMTNAKDDKLLASGKYQKKLAAGMADGVDKFFGHDGK